MYRLVWVVAVVLLPCFGFPVFADEVGHVKNEIDHVSYLASPKLKGRKSMTKGSRKAQEYIVEHFTELGLVPWGDAESYLQSVVMGTNVIGVLPGSDPVLKDEIVLISAHYDHLGKKHLGAADNAAGTAALMELAARFARAEEHPKRTIAFAAFDVEERGLMGSISFAGREDFDSEAIVMNINIDMLGRKGFDLFEDTLFMAITHDSPAVHAAHEKISDFNILSVPSYFTNMRGDHAVFEGLGIPIQFISCGLYGDYHQEEDTLENLELELLSDSVDAIQQTVSVVANEPVLELHPIAESATDTMIVSGHKLLTMVLEHPVSALLPPEVLESFRDLQGQMLEHIEASECDVDRHNAIVYHGILAMQPMVSMYEGSIFAEEGEAGESDTKADHE